MKKCALIFVWIHCLLVGGCVSDRLMEKMIENAEFVPVESVENDDVGRTWESDRLLRELFPRARAKRGELGPSTKHGEWEVFSFEKYFYGRNIKNPEMEFLTSGFVGDGESVILKGDSVLALNRGKWLKTGPETKVSLKGTAFETDGPARIVLPDGVR